MNGVLFFSLDSLLPSSSALSRSASSVTRETTFLLRICAIHTNYQSQSHTHVTTEFLNLLHFNENASAVLRVEEDNRLAVGTNLWLVADCPDLRLFALADSLLDVLDLDADVVETTRGVFVEERLNRALLTEGVEELELRVGQFHENSGNAVLGEILRGGDFGVEESLVHGGCLVDILGFGDRDGDMVEASEAQRVRSCRHSATNDGAEHSRCLYVWIFFLLFSFCVVDVVEV